MVHQIPFSFGKFVDLQKDSGSPSFGLYWFLDKNFVRFYGLKVNMPCVNKRPNSGLMRKRLTFQAVERKCIINGIPEEVLDEDEELCPVECVREFKTDEEFLALLEKAKNTDSLVVVDFYRTSCGSCKYIEQGFAKLCRGAGDEESAVIFLKHNVIDEYDEQSEVAERLRIKSVPLFHFYKNGALLEAFATRDKERINAAIQKYTTPAAQTI